MYGKYTVSTGNPDPKGSLGRPKRVSKVKNYIEKKLASFIFS